MNDIPVLLLAFNRPKHCSMVFDRVRQLRPSKLYLACDGARSYKPGEADKVAAVRHYLTSNVDWPCELKTLFRDTNLGCKLAVSQGIDWFFEYETMGIILEDDCLPDVSFFRYCRQLLLRYEHDTRVWMISGFNPLREFPSPASYFFTHFGFCWGWATWRRAWRNFDVNMTKWPKAKEVGITKSYPFFPSRNREFQETYESRIDTWDYQWYFSMASNSGLSIVAGKNLVQNIGFDDEATHTTIDPSQRGKIPAFQIPDQLIHPEFIFANGKFESKFLAEALEEVPFYRRIINKLRRIVTNDK